VEEGIRMRIPSFIVFLVGLSFASPRKMFEAEAESRLNDLAIPR